MATILQISTVIRDGMHNGFTDLQFWQGAYWVGYRKGAGHVSLDAHAVVAVSHDRQRFTEISTAKVRGDVRDPKLFPIDDDRMAMYFPTWTQGAGQIERDGKNYLKPIQQYITFTTNGKDWEPAQPILEPNMWLWRVRRHDGKYYGLVQNLTQGWTDMRPHQLDLMVSDDLLTWKHHARVGNGLNESDIIWRPDGEAWIVSRSADANIGSVFAWAKAPYTDWQTVDMAPKVHAPIMIEHNGELFVAGRSHPAFEGITDAPFEGNSMSMWRVSHGKLESVLRFPASGDCSYAGLIKDPEGRICMSYYSQHAYNYGVLPRRDLVDHAGNREDVAIAPSRTGSAADVYFAEISLP